METRVEDDWRFTADSKSKLMAEAVILKARMSTYLLFFIILDTCICTRHFKCVVKIARTWKRKYNLSKAAQKACDTVEYGVSEETMNAPHQPHSIKIFSSAVNDAPHSRGNHCFPHMTKNIHLHYNLLPQTLRVY